jgi:hypothetical protein
LVNYPCSFLFSFDSIQSFIHSIRRHVAFYEFLLVDNCSLQWWAYEIVVLLSGLLSNPQLETSVLSVWYALRLCLYFGDFTLMFKWQYYLI